MSAADRLNEIEARANAATKGPWSYEGKNHIEKPLIEWQVIRRHPGGEWEEIARHRDPAKAAQVQANSKAALPRSECIIRKRHVTVHYGPWEEIA